MDHEGRAVGITPRLIIHGGAGNVERKGYPAEKYDEYRTALLTMVRNTHVYMTSEKQPSALAAATHAVVQLEDCPLFNSARGAVFTRDGVNQLEASVMVSRGRAKRGVGVGGLRRVRNPVLLARAMLEHGERDLDARGQPSSATAAAEDAAGGDADQRLDVPSAQGHTFLWGEAAEQLATSYGLAKVDPSYYFTQQRWDEHMRALERERRQLGPSTWSADEFLPQGTCGAVAVDRHGVVCAATSTGGMTNKLTGRVGDTPVPGAGFWAEEWVEGGDDAPPTTLWERLAATAAPGLSFAGPLRGMLADCLPTPFTYSPLAPSPSFPSAASPRSITTRATALSGTGNGDSFLRTCAAHSVVALARHKPLPAAAAFRAVAGPGGELQRSAGDRWGRTGEGEGGMIGVECVVERDARSGRVLRARSEVVMEYNCAGMYRAWIDDKGEAVMSVWTNGSADSNPP